MIISVSAVIGFRGFKSGRQAPVEQRVVLRSPNADREAGSVAPVVIGSRHSATTTVRRGSSARRPVRRSAPSARAAARVRKAPTRTGGSAPAVKAPKKQPAPAAQEAPSQPETPPANTHTAPVVPTVPANPVGDLVEKVVRDVQEPVQKTVGEVLLDLRDVLP
jgi:hypothetical protein